MNRFRFLPLAGMLGLAFTFPVMAAPGAKGPLDDVINDKMNYAQLRKAVLDAKWTPVRDPQCDSNVYGAQGGPRDATNICAQLPELEACSGDGYCSMYFEHKSSDRKIHVVTYGDYARWNLPGEQDDLAIAEWSYQ